MPHPHCLHCNEYDRTTYVNSQIALQLTFHSCKNICQILCQVYSSGVSRVSNSSAQGKKQGPGFCTSEQWRSCRGAGGAVAPPWHISQIKRRRRRRRRRRERGRKGERKKKRKRKIEESKKQFSCSGSSSSKVCIAMLVPGWGGRPLVWIKYSLSKTATFCNLFTPSYQKIMSTASSKQGFILEYAPERIHIWGAVHDLPPHLPMWNMPLNFPK